MTGVGPTDQRPHPPMEDDAAAPPAADRRGRQTFANMLRSLLPLVVIILVVVGWTAFRQSPDVDPVKGIDPSSTVQLAANRAGYPLLVPTDLPHGYVATSARTDAGNAEKGDPVTLQIGYVTPSEQFAQFVVSDDPRADAVTGLLNDATPAGSVQIGSDSWTRAIRQHERDEETVLSRTLDGVTVVVSGSASEKELETVAGAVRPYSG
jgi:hypothetical protein